ncbi:MAG: nicotinate-nucleotide--dimethylbenzimidazole phosphoribosyltransferase [Candidatus Omnitrophota bacterium]
MKNLIPVITGIDQALMNKTQQRLDNLTKPPGSLGRLEELAKQICAITGEENPRLDNKVIFTLAADHGVVEEGVSAFPQEVTAQMVYNFLKGGAGINVLAKHVGARVVVVDMGVAEEIKNQKSKIKNFVDKKIAWGSKNFVKGPAMTKEEAIRSICAGKEVFAQEYRRAIDIVGLGEMGIGNTTASSALVACLTSTAVKTVTGRGTGLDEVGLRHKISVIQKAIAVNKPDAKDALDVLAKLGGFEIGGLCGIALAAAEARVPVVIDGFIASAAALLAFCLEPRIKDYLIASHCSVERGHKIILKHMGLKPLLDLDLRLGEGTGAALGIGLAEAAVKILTQMATFKGAGVSEKNRV